MELIYIRHGQSVNNASWATKNYDGMREDPELTELGEAQARAAGTFLRDEGHDAWRKTEGEGIVGAGITHLYCSLMMRAAQTGTAISEAINVPLVAHMDMHEMGGMRFRKRPEDEYVGKSGKDGSFFSEHFPDMILPKEVKPDVGWWYDRPPETREDCLLRGSRMLNDLLLKHAGTDDVVAMVSHGAFYKYFAASILNLPEIDHLWLNHFNTGMTRFVFQDGRVIVDFTNRLDHLTHDLYSA